METILRLRPEEINLDLLEVLRRLFSITDITQIVIEKQHVTLKEFDKTLPLNEVINSLKQGNHTPEFISEIENGLKKSSIYASEN